MDPRTPRTRPAARVAFLVVRRASPHLRRASAVLLAFTGVLLSACANERSGDVSAKPLRMLALGDSYTIGESVPERERWPAQLANRLSERGLPMEPPTIIARTGWSTAQLRAAIENATLTPPYDLVTLLIGVNDQFRSFEPDGYASRVDELLTRAIELAGGRTAQVVVVSIPDYGVTPFGQRMDPERIAAELDRYNTLNREAAQRAGVPFVDITPISREAAQDPELIAADGLHPSGKMYARWTDQILPLAEQALRGDTRARP